MHYISNLDREEEEWYDKIYQGNKIAELTLKVFVVGAILVVLLIASNIYLGLKIGFTQGGSLIAALLGFVIIKSLRGNLTILENNNIQTIASAGASLGIMVSAIPAIIMLGYSFTWFELLLWIFLANILGVIFSIPLRKQFVVIEKLPFPSGTACASTIRAMHAKEGQSIKQAKWLGIVGLFSGIITWFRDAVPSIVPSMTMFPGKVSGYLLAQLNMGINWSPMLLGVGFLVGPRIGISLLLGSIAGWVILGPLLANAGIIQGIGYRAIRDWTMWSAIALMVASGITSLIIKGGTIIRAINSMKNVKLNKYGNLEISFNTWLITFIVIVILISAVMQIVFGIPFWMTIIAVIISYLFSIIAVRTYGETDINPVGAMGYATQIIFGGVSPGNTLTNVMAAGIAASGANQSADMMQDFKTGYLLGATPKKQTYAQTVGVIIGSIVAVPIFYAIINAYGLASENLPAPSAVTWTGMAQFLSKGFGALPAFTHIGVISGVVLGIFLALMENTKIKKFVPSAFGIGIAMFLPAFFSVSIFLGSIIKFALEKVFPAWMKSYSIPVASGAIVGESILGVIIAILIVSGII